MQSELAALPAACGNDHATWWVARSWVAQLAGEAAEAADALSAAISLTHDTVENAFLSEQREELLLRN